MANRSTNPGLSAKKGYSHIKSFNVAGVTFDNRQKTLKKPLEMRKKVVYNGCKWWKVVNSGRKWGESGRPISKRGEFIVNRRI